MWRFGEEWGAGMGRVEWRVNIALVLHCFFFFLTTLRILH